MRKARQVISLRGDAFLLAARRLQIMPRYCVMFEDAVAGIKAARAAGMVSVGMTTFLSKDILADADMCMPDFREIDLNEIGPLSERAKNKK